MITVIFEVQPHDGQEEAYFQYAADLRAELETMDGFVSIERFRSTADPNRILSLSFWRDEKAVAQWRNTKAHRRTQTAGRDVVFNDYRLRVAEVLRDYGLKDRRQAPEDSVAEHG